MNTTEKLMSTADRAFELLEQKSHHQLAVELAELQQKHDIALAALNKMQDQRDQLAAQLKDATAQCVLSADLLRQLREGAEIHLHNCTVCKNAEGIANWTSKLERIDAALSGKMPEEFIIARGKLPELNTEEVNRLLRTGPIIRVNKPAVPEGWQLVPMEPTSDMTSNAMMKAAIKYRCQDVYRRVYRAMLAAAPKPEGGER